MKEKILEICRSVNDGIDYSSDKLIDSGALESVTLVEIVSELMEQFEIEIPYEEIIPDNFNSVDAMARLVEKYV